MLFEDLNEAFSSGLILLCPQIVLFFAGSLDCMTDYGVEVALIFQAYENMVFARTRKQYDCGDYYLHVSSTDCSTLNMSVCVFCRFVAATQEIISKYIDCSTPIKT